MSFAGASKTSKSAGARGDVQNFSGCQAPAAPVLTQALYLNQCWKKTKWSPLASTVDTEKGKNKEFKKITYLCPVFVIIKNPINSF